jgi:hypothetical protein
MNLCSDAEHRSIEALKDLAHRFPGGPFCLPDLWLWDVDLGAHWYDHLIVFNGDQSFSMKVN